MQCGCQRTPMSLNAFTRITQDMIEEANKAPSLVEVLRKLQRQDLKHELQPPFKKARSVINKPLDQDNRTSLHHAASLGNPAIVQALIDRGATVSGQDDNKRTPLP